MEVEPGTDAPLTDDEAIEALEANAEAVYEDAPVEEAEVVDELADDPADESLDEPESEPVSWVDDFAREVARLHDIDEEDLEAFGSHRAFATALKYKAAQDRFREPELAPEAPKEVEYVDAPFDADGNINVEFYRRNDYDDSTIALAESQYKIQKELQEYKAQHQTVEQRAQQAELDRYYNAVHDAYDGMDPEFYGVSKEGETFKQLSKVHGERRERVHAKAEILQRAYHEAKSPMPPLSQLLAEAEYLVYGKEKQAKAAQKQGEDRQAQLERLAKQSRKRRPAGNTSGSRNRKSTDVDPYDTKSIANDPAIVAFWEDRGTK